MLRGKTPSPVPKGFKKGELTNAVLRRYPRSQWWMFAVEDEKAMSELEALRGQYDESKKRLDSASWTRSRRCSAATKCLRAS
jgi:DNA-directed RNA polymerase subunit beta